MTKKFALPLAALCILAMVAAAGPKIEFSWKNPNFTGGPFKNILVLALDGKATNRAEFEDELVAAISRSGQQAAPSYEFIPRPDSTPIDEKDLRAIVKEQKFDAILVARLTKRGTKTTYVPGAVYTPLPYYGTFYGYYAALYPVIYSPGYLETEKEVQVEVNTYSSAKPNGELVWTGTTNTFSVGSVKKAIKGLVKVIGQELEKETIISRESE